MAAGKWRKESEEKIIRAVTLSNLMNIYLDYSSNEYAHLSPSATATVWRPLPPPAAWPISAAIPPRS